MNVNKKELMFCMPEALLAEGFKSCKTVKQENTSQETSKWILIKAQGNSIDKISERVMPSINIDLKNEKMETS